MRHTEIGPADDTATSRALVLTITLSAHHTLLSASGDLTAATVTRFAVRLHDELALMPQAMIIDLSRAKYCAVQAIDELATAARRAHCAGISVAVVSDRGELRRSIETFQLHHALSQHGTLEDARARLHAVPRPRRPPT